MRSTRSALYRGGKVVAVLTVAGVLASCGGSGKKTTGAKQAESKPAASRGTVKVGFITPLSGQFAAIGTSFKNAMDLYLSQHGNRLGDRDVSLDTVDEGAGAADAVPGARKLVQQDQVDVATGVVSSATAAAVFPMFDQAKTPVVLAQGFPTPVPQANPSKYLWSTGSSNPPYTASMGKYLASKIDPSKGVFFIASDYVQGHSIIDATKNAYQSLGGKVAGEAYPPLGTTLDFQPYLSKIKQSGATAVYSFFAGSDAVKFVKQYKDFGLAGQIPLYSTSSLVEGNLQAEGDAAVGITTNAHYATTLDNPENAAFVKAYKDKYGTEPDHFAVQEYDAATLLDKAIGTITGPLTGDNIADALAQVGDLRGPRGTWHVDKLTHVPVHTMYLLEVKQQSGNLVNSIVEQLGVFDPATGQLQH